MLIYFDLSSSAFQMSYSSSGSLRLAIQSTLDSLRCKTEVKLYPEYVTYRSFLQKNR